MYILCRNNEKLGKERDAFEEWKLFVEMESRKENAEQEFNIRISQYYVANVMFVNICYVRYYSRQFWIYIYTKWCNYFGVALFNVFKQWWKVIFEGHIWETILCVIENTKYFQKVQVKKSTPNDQSFKNLSLLFAWKFQYWIRVSYKLIHCSILRSLLRMRWSISCWGFWYQAT